MNGIEVAAKVARILSSEGLGGAQLERLVISLVSAIEGYVSTDPADDKVLAERWAAATIAHYTDADGTFRTGPYSKIGMIKDLRAAYPSLRLVEAKEIVERSAGLRALRTKLSG